MAGMNITDDRHEVINFTRPYAGARAAGRAATRPLAQLPGPGDEFHLERQSAEARATINQMREPVTGRTIGVQISTTHARLHLRDLQRRRDDPRVSHHPAARPRPAAGASTRSSRRIRRWPPPLKRFRVPSHRRRGLRRRPARPWRRGRAAEGGRRSRDDVRYRHRRGDRGRHSADPQHEMVPRRHDAAGSSRPDGRPARGGIRTPHP